MNEFWRKKTVRLAVPLLAALLSVFLLSGIASSAKFHGKTLEALEEKQQTVLELTAASAAASAAITLIPGDTATPIADKLADLSSGFLVVLCAIYLEKYLLTITGHVAFSYLIPAACALYMLDVFMNWDVLRSLARKLILFGIIIAAAIPASVAVSGMIEENYRESIEATVDAAREADLQKELEAEIEEEKAEEEKSGGFLSNLFSSVAEGISGAASEISDRVGSLVTDFMEALAVMIVTSCLIPILVLMFFGWAAKTIFGIEAVFSCSDAFRSVRNVFPTGRKHTEE